MSASLHEYGGFNFRGCLDLSDAAKIYQALKTQLASKRGDVFKNVGVCSERLTCKHRRVLCESDRACTHVSLPSLLAEEEVREEVGHVLVELILGRQQHRLVVEEQQQQVEEEEHHDSKHHHEDGRNAVLLGNHTSLRVQWLQQVRQTSADAVAFWEGVAFTVRCCSLGVAHRVVAWPFCGHLIVPDHVDLALRGGRVHEAQLAIEQPKACAGKQRKGHRPQPAILASDSDF